MRCTGKDSIKYYDNYKGNGKLFSVDLLDCEGSEIRATGFNATVDTLYSIFETGKIFLIENARVTIVRQKYTHIKNDYGITLNENSKVTLVDNDASIPMQRYRVTPIMEIRDCVAGDFVDIIGVVLVVNKAVSVLNTKTQRRILKRTMILCDSSNASIELSLWDDQAQEYDETKIMKESIIGVKGARVSDFGGKSICLQGTIDINLNGVEVNELIQWWRTRNKNPSTQALTCQFGGYPSYVYVFLSVSLEKHKMCL